MSTLHCPIRLDSMDGDRSLQLDALVDTGSLYTTVPASLLKRLGVAPTDKARLELADGRRDTYDIGEARAAVEERSTATWVVFGEDDARPCSGRTRSRDSVYRSTRPRRLWNLHARGTPFIGRPGPGDSGTYTLEGLRLSVDPAQETLEPMPYSPT